MMDSTQDIPAGEYRHYKGRCYEVLGVARHSENEEEFVVYRALYGDYGLWIRPKQLFLEPAVVDGKVVPRFQHQAKGRKSSPAPDFYSA